MKEAFTRAPRHQVRAGSLVIGAPAPVSVQSMCKTDTRDVAATVAQVAALEAAGCQLVRVAVPDLAAAQVLGEIKRQIAIPLVADIHFDYRLALEAIRQGVDKLRLNPGNLRHPEHLRAVVEAAAEAGIPIRVGANTGSLPPDLLAQVRGRLHEPETAARTLVQSALRHVEILEGLGFQEIVISLKAFDVPAAVLAYRLMHQERDYPLHLGITEAGPPPWGSVRSAVGIGALLAQGIGDTIRVSLTADPREEVLVAREILQSLELQAAGLTFVSCPTCGRCRLNLRDLAVTARERLQPLDDRLRRAGATLRVAVMGCEVNGPGEAKEADLGVAGGAAGGVLFSRGKLLRRVPFAELLPALLAEAEQLALERIAGRK